jgi:kumamolisin
MPGAKALSEVNPAERFSVTVLLRPKSEMAIAAKNGKAALAAKRHLTREEFAAKHGAHPEDIQKVEEFAHDNELDVSSVDLARRSVVLSGTVASFNRAFRVDLKRYEHAGGEYRGRTGSVYVPQSLAKVVQGVFGLDDRPHAKPHFRVLNGSGGIAPRSGSTSYTPVQVAKLYNFPSGATGAGETIAIIELGGGYKTTDLNTYFSALGVSPQVSAVSVDGGHNSPTGSANGPDGEVMLDIEVAGAVAPKARLVVYFSPNTDRGFLDAITTAVHDPIRKPSIVSISWGGPEASWTAQALTAFNQAFQAAAKLGVTVCVASGDNGSTDGATNGRQNVDFPASSPYVLACGGTSLMASNGHISQETVWNDGANGGATGGGVSDVFAKPAWQSSAGVPPSANPGHKSGRGVPDVSGDADPETGYRVRVDGVNTVIGGTSAVAPLWAGLTALLNQKLGRSVGYMNPFLYGTGHSTLHDIVIGNNGAYPAKPGWDACTGWGSPNGGALLTAMH